jgi:hypothetical protein
MTTPARSRDQKSAPIDDLSPTLTLRDGRRAQGSSPAGGPHTAPSVTLDPWLNLSPCQIVRARCSLACVGR